MFWNTTSVLYWFKPLKVVEPWSWDRASSISVCFLKQCFNNQIKGGLIFFTLYISGLAFHPLDGILQALPHSLTLFVVPVHFNVHLVLLFIEILWSSNIHDCIHGKLWPVMGAGYHTIHHTTYRHNYGHYTIWMDWIFSTLRDPEEVEGNVKWIVYMIKAQLISVSSDKCYLWLDYCWNKFGWLHVTYILRSLW